MSFWRGQPGQIAPVALLLLAALLSLPFLLYLFRPTGSAAPETADVVGQVKPAVGAETEPTVGMQVDADGYGSVSDAPIKLVSMAEGDASPTVPRSGISPDVARFIRGIPAIESKRATSGDPQICTLEGPTMWAGYIQLRKGCFVFRHDNPDIPDALLMLPSYAIGRDGDGYLTISSPPYTPEDTLRVGEREGVFVGKGCSQPDYLPAPEPLAAQCGAERVINLAHLGRVPLCSAKAIARLEASRAQHEQTAQRIQHEHDRCVAEGNPVRDCPPAQIPPPIESFRPGCRLPE